MGLDLGHALIDVIGVGRRWRRGHIGLRKFIDDDLWMSIQKVVMQTLVDVGVWISVEKYLGLLNGEFLHNKKGVMLAMSSKVTCRLAEMRYQEN